MTLAATSSAASVPPDQRWREAALDPARSFLVQAPAGSGKTDLLTRRFLRLLSEVPDPANIVAITFTKAAAAEMRNRVLSELEAAAQSGPVPSEEFSIAAIAAKAMQHSQKLGWNLLDSPELLRISTIDSFCRSLAIQQPLLSGLGGNLELSDNVTDLYRIAARRTLQRLASPSPLGAAIETLLIWRDNNWKDVEDQLLAMLSQRDRWMHDFVLNGEHDWDLLRSRLEQPMARTVSQAVHNVSHLLGAVPGACEEAHALSRFACSQNGLHRDLAELADFPCGPFVTAEQLENARRAFLCLSSLLMKDGGEFRQQVDKRHGFPSGSTREKERLKKLIQDLQNVSGLQAALAALSSLPPAQYSEEEWAVVRASFTVLRHAAAELKVAFDEAGRVDFSEVSQRASAILQAEDQLPTDAGMAIADEIHHLLVDEFQDTSRRQHKLLAGIVGAWPDTEGRTLFVVGDPMQSIYFFRDADAELFPRVRDLGLELHSGERFPLHFAPLSANFRTAHSLVEENNKNFAAIFDVPDSSGIRFSPSVPARTWGGAPTPPFHLHLAFLPQLNRVSADPACEEIRLQQSAARDEAKTDQLSQIIERIRTHLPRIREAQATGTRYRVAVLARARRSLIPIAAALRKEGIPFRAVELEVLSERPEVRDAVALAKAILNPEDRVAWMAVLRAPWCGLPLRDLHVLISNDDPALLAQSIPILLEQRQHLLTSESRSAITRLTTAVSYAASLRTAAPELALGTWLRLAWERIGGSACVDATARENLSLLWSALDKLPNGEVDLLSETLQAALEHLTAQPDPTTSTIAGVQLMTIHKSKGLEFEVVLVPDLQSRSGRSANPMLSWLERGVADPDASEFPTEFLIAPRQSKGADRGLAKAWVDSVRTERERQETRRLLYVAATRAREELHLYALVEYKEGGQNTLANPPESLLKTAWPALQSEIEARFLEWNNGQQEIPAIAASGNLLVMPSPASVLHPARLHRLPSGYIAPQPAAHISPANRAEESDAPYQRHKGNISSRALGVAVHMLLQTASTLPVSLDWHTTVAGLEHALPSVVSAVRSLGLPQANAQSLVREALQIVQRALQEPTAQWIFSAHPDAASETAWTGWRDGSIRTVRMDRVFRAGATPLSEGDSFWWVIDYKTAELGPLAGEEAILQLRHSFAPQLELYATVLRGLHGSEIPIRAGLFYPRMRLFDWWEL